MFDYTVSRLVSCMIVGVNARCLRLTYLPWWFHALQYCRTFFSLSMTLSNNNVHKILFILIFELKNNLCSLITHMVTSDLQNMVSYYNRVVLYSTKNFNHIVLRFAPKNCTNFKNYTFFSFCGEIIAIRWVCCWSTIMLFAICACK